MKIEKEKNLKEFTTFRIGGNAQFFCAIESEWDLVEAIAFSRAEKLPVFILGGGSNILISDAGFKGLVIKMEIKGVDFIEDENGNVRVTAKAGEDWDDFVLETVKRGLHGLENLSAIPGTVGAAPVQNIGAYGSEVKDTIESVRVFDIKDNIFKDFLNKDCQFEYRGSMFKKEAGRYIIISATFILKKDGKVNFKYKDLQEYFISKDIKNPTLKDVREAVVHIRANKLPDVKKIGTAGSFFKNSIIARSQAHELKAKYPDLPIYPVDDERVKISLAWILDHVCNYRGASIGNVGTYKNQALVIVNNGEATAAEITAFADEIKKNVKEKTGIDIEAEVQII